MSRCFEDIKEEREAEIEAMIKYIKDFEEAKEFLRSVYWLNYRLIDNNDNLRQYNEEYEEEIEALKKQLIWVGKQLEKVKELAEKEIKECDKLLQEEFEDDYYIQAVNARQSMCYEFRREIDNRIRQLKEIK